MKSRHLHSLLALFATLALLFGQVLIQQHVHADEAPGSECVICVQGDHSPLISSSPSAVYPPLVDNLFAAEPITDLAIEPLSHCRARAPPAP